LEHVRLAVVDNQES